MTKIRISESELRSLIKESVIHVLDETFKRAGRVRGINYNAQRNYQLYGTPNARIIMDNTEQLKLSYLTHAINKDIPCFAPVFMENVDGEMYTVALQFVSVAYWRNNRVVLSGPLSVSRREYKTGYIEYDETTEKFYRVSLSKERRITRITEITIDTADSENVQSIYRFKEGMKEAEQQTETDVAAINASGPTPQRTHLPYGAYPNKTRSRLGIDKVK